MCYKAFRTIKRRMIKTTDTTPHVRFFFLKKNIFIDYTPSYNGMQGALILEKVF